MSVINVLSYETGSEDPVGSVETEDGDGIEAVKDSTMSRIRSSVEEGSEERISFNFTCRA